MYNLPIYHTHTHTLTCIPEYISHLVYTHIQVTVKPNTFILSSCYVRILLYNLWLTKTDPFFRIVCLCAPWLFAVELGQFRSCIAHPRCSDRFHVTRRGFSATRVTGSSGCVRQETAHLLSVLPLRAAKRGYYNINLCSF